MLILLEQVIGNRTCMGVQKALSAMILIRVITRNKLHQCQKSAKVHFQSKIIEMVLKAMQLPSKFCLQILLLIIKKIDVHMRSI